MLFISKSSPNIFGQKTKTKTKKSSKTQLEDATTVSCIYW